MRRLCALLLLLALAPSPSAAQVVSDPRFGIDEGLSSPAAMTEIGAG